MAVKILKKESLIPGRTSRLVLEAPHIAETAKPGHFIILRINEKGERFPLTIADTDKKRYDHHCLSRNGNINDPT